MGEVWVAGLLSKENFLLRVECADTKHLPQDNV